MAGSLAVLCATGLAGCRSRPPEPQGDDPVPVPVYIGPAGAGRGLCVVAESPVHATGPEAGVIRLSVENRTGADVFIQVDGYDAMGFCLLRREGEARSAPGAGADVGRADADWSYGRIRYLQGVKTGRSVVHITGTVGAAGELAACIGSEIGVYFRPRGYFRKTGRAFTGSVAVPVPVVD